jgi:hypothetical protein
MFLKYFRLHCEHYNNESKALAAASRTRRRWRTAYIRRHARDASSSAGCRYCSVDTESVNYDFFENIFEFFVNIALTKARHWPRRRGRDAVEVPPIDGVAPATPQLVLASFTAP